MDYSKLTDKELDKMRANIRLQQEALENLDDLLVEEQSKRYAKGLMADMDNHFNTIFKIKK